MGTGLWQDVADEHAFHCQFIPTFACRLSIPVVSQCLHKRALHRPVPVRRRFRLDQVGHDSLEPEGSDSLRLKESLVLCCMKMTGPGGQSSSLGAAIKGFNRVEEAVS